MLRMPPPNQRLDALDGAGLQRHDRLVMQLELFGVDGFSQIVLHVHPPAEPLLHFGVKEHILALASQLRLVHGGVRVAQNILGALVQLAAGHHADARGRDDLVASDLVGLGQGSEDAFGHGRRVGRIRNFFQQYDKFIASKPRGGVSLGHAAHGVDGSHFVLESFGDSISS